MSLLKIPPAQIHKHVIKQYHLGGEVFDDEYDQLIESGVSKEVICSELDKVQKEGSVNNKAFNDNLAFVAYISRRLYQLSGEFGIPFNGTEEDSKEVLLFTYKTILLKMENPTYVDFEKGPIKLGMRLGFDLDQINKDIELALQRRKKNLYEQKLSSLRYGDRKYNDTAKEISNLGKELGFADEEVNKEIQEAMREGSKGLYYDALGLLNFYTRTVKRFGEKQGIPVEEIERLLKLATDRVENYQLP